MEGSGGGRGSEGGGRGAMVRVGEVLGVRLYPLSHPSAGERVSEKREKKIEVRRKPGKRPAHRAAFLPFADRWEAS